MKTHSSCARPMLLTKYYNSSAIPVRLISSSELDNCMFSPAMQLVIPVTSSS